MTSAREGAHQRRILAWASRVNPPRPGVLARRRSIEQRSYPLPSDVAVRPSDVAATARLQGGVVTSVRSGDVTWPHSDFAVHGPGKRGGSEPSPDAQGLGPTQSSESEGVRRYRAALGWPMTSASCSTLTGLTRCASKPASRVRAFALS